MLESKIDRFRMYVSGITDQNVADLRIPEDVVNVQFSGQLSEYVVPDHIEDFWCSGMGMTSLKLNDGLEWLVASQNNLESLELPQSLVCASLSTNKLTSLTARAPLTNLKVLDIRHNNFEKFDLLLSKSMEQFWIEGNPMIKIRYIDFIFRCDQNDNVCGLIDGDFGNILGGGPYLAQSEWTRHCVAQRAHTGQKYIDIAKFAW